MFFDLKKEKVILEMEQLIKDAEKFESESSLYVKFMRDQILSVTTNN